MHWSQFDGVPLLCMYCIFMLLCMYVCMYVCCTGGPPVKHEITYPACAHGVCVRVCRYKCMAVNFTWFHGCVSVCVYTRWFLLRVCMCVCVHTHADFYSVCACVCVSRMLQVCTYLYVVCIHKQELLMHTHTYIHTFDILAYMQCFKSLQNIYLI
jgi:hypothetical protein